MGYWSSKKQKCKKCVGSEALFYAIYILILLGVAIGVFYIMLPTHSSFCVEQVHLRLLSLQSQAIMGLLLGNVTVLVIIGNLDLKFNALTKALLSMPDTLIDLDFLADWECLESFGFTKSSDKVLPLFAFINLRPVFLLFLVFGYYTLFSKIPGLKRLPGTKKPNLYQGTGLLIGFFETFSVIIAAGTTKTAFSVYNHPFPRDNLKSITVQPGILTDDDKYSTLLTVAIPALLLWCFGFIAVIALLLNKAKTEINKDSRYGKVLQGVFARFDERSSWFILASLCRRILLGFTTSLSVIFDSFQEATVQAFWMIFILLVALFLNAYIQPFRLRALFLVDQVCMCSIVTILTATTLLTNHPNTTDVIVGLAILQMFGFSFYNLYLAVQRYRSASAECIMKARDVGNKAYYQRASDKGALMEQRSTKTSVASVVSKGCFLQTGCHPELVAALEAVSFSVNGPDTPENHKVRAAQCGTSLPDNLLDSMNRILANIKNTHGTLHAGSLMNHAENETTLRVRGDLYKKMAAENNGNPVSNDVLEEAVSKHLERQVE